MSRREQGELAEDDDVVLVEDDEPSPAHSEEEEEEDPHYEEEYRSPQRHDDEEELGPEIKPPQAKQKKEKHKHSKHKRSDKRRPHDDRDRSDRHASSTHSRGSDSHGRDGRAKDDRSRMGDRDRRKDDRKGRDAQGRDGRDARPLRDARDVIDEGERRKRSMRERERLEQMEKERVRLEKKRHRLEEERQRHQERLENREKIDRAEREWERQRRAQRQKPPKDDSEYSRAATRHDVEQRRERDKARPPRSRSPQQRRHDDQDYRRGGGQNDYQREDDRRVVERGDSRMRRDRGGAERYDNRRHDEHMDDRGAGRDERYDDRYHDQQQGHHDDERYDEHGEEEYDQHEEEQEQMEHSEGEEEVQPEAEEEAEEQRSSDEQSRASRSESEGSESEGSERQHSRHRPDKVKSKFESESEAEESEAPSGGEDERDDERDGSDREEEGNYVEETPPESPVELLPDLPPYYPAIQGCRNVEEFSCLNRIEEGTYGVVYRARDKKTDEVVALKRLKMEKEKEGFPITSLREINTLLKAQHQNIVTVREIVVGSNMDRIYIVMDYVEHDLKSLMETMKEDFILGEVKTLMIQLLRGVRHLHDNWIIHRDLKTSNLLFSHAGILKIGDFGLAREYGSPLRHYTPIVVTLWYRAPELLLACKKYSIAIDMWSVGCIMAEFLTRKALFPGKSEIDELNRIFKDLGTPNEKIWPGIKELKGWQSATFADYPYNNLRNRLGPNVSDKCFDIVNRFLTYDPTRRISANEALGHEWFEESPHPVDPSMFPTWPAKSEQSRRSTTQGNSPKPPSGGKAYSKLLGDEDVGGFHLGGQSRGANSGPGFALKF